MYSVVTNPKFYSLRRYSIEVRLCPFGIEAFFHATLLD